jgi:predicted peptidase
MNVCRAIGGGDWILYLSLLGVFAFAASAARAADDEPEARLFQGADGKVLPYRLAKPLHFDPHATYPLILFLHGAGERGKDNRAQLLHVMPELLTPANREKYPCFVVAPQCPAGQKWVDVNWSAHVHKQPEQPSAAMALTLQLLESLEREFPIDGRRLYVMGLSMGGYGTWDVIARHPQMFAAAVPICGGGDETTAPRFAGVPVWAFHGAKDNTVPVSRTRKMIEALQQAGGKPRYTEYPDCQHNSWDSAIHEPDLLPWLFAQQVPLIAGETGRGWGRQLPACPSEDVSLRHHRRAFRRHGG